MDVSYECSLRVGQVTHRPASGPYRNVISRPLHGGSTTSCLFWGNRVRPRRGSRPRTGTARACAGPTALVTAARTQRLPVVNTDRRLITSSARKPHHQHVVPRYGGR